MMKAVDLPEGSSIAKDKNMDWRLYLWGISTVMSKINNEIWNVYMS